MGTQILKLGNYGWVQMIGMKSGVQLLVPEQDRHDYPNLWPQSLWLPPGWDRIGSRDGCEASTSNSTYVASTTTCAYRKQKSRTLFQNQSSHNKDSGSYKN